MSESNLVPYEKLARGSGETTTILFDEDSTASTRFTRNFERFDIWIDVPSTPGAGTMSILTRPRGSAQFRVLKSDVDMVNGPRDYSIDAVGMDAVQLIPDSLDTAYDVRGYGKDQ